MLLFFKQRTAYEMSISDWSSGVCSSDLADPGSNAMNWQYVAGTGVDAPVFSRIMSPLLQSERFAMGDYVRTYVPELAHLSDAEITAAPGPEAGVPAYPAPLIGPEEARARARPDRDALPRQRTGTPKQRKEAA